MPARLHLQRSGRTVVLQPGQSMLAALRTARVHLRSACHGGSCGACEVRVIAGRPWHRDPVHGPGDRPPHDRVRPCVSLSATDDLTLDL